MNKKYLAVIALIVVVGFALFVFFPRLTQPSNISVQFYKDGEPVGKPLSTLPLGAVFMEGKEVDGFTVTVHWQTSDPSADAIDWAIFLKVQYLIEDNPFDPKWGVVFDDLLWTKGCGSLYWENGAGSLESGIYPLDAFHEIPAETGFSMEFTGTFRFLCKAADPTGANPLFMGEFVPLTLSGYHGAYEYLCWVGW